MSFSKPDKEDVNRVIPACTWIMGPPLRSVDPGTLARLGAFELTLKTTTDGKGLPQGQANDLPTPGQGAPAASYRFDAAPATQHAVWLGDILLGRRGNINRQRVGDPPRRARIAIRGTTGPRIPSPHQLHGHRTSTTGKASLFLTPGPGHYWGHRLSSHGCRDSPLRPRIPHHVALPSTRPLSPTPATRGPEMQRSATAQCSFRTKPSHDVC